MATWTKIWDFVTKYPRIGMGVCVVGCMPFADSFLKGRTKQLIRPVFAKLEVGSKPPVPLTNIDRIIDRSEVVEELKKVIGFGDVGVDETVDEVGDEKDKIRGFVIIVGPSGTGKTFTIRQLCNEFPKGALYVEIVNATSFTDDVTKECHIKTAPSGVIDLLLGHISHNYKRYYDMPEQEENKLAAIMNVLKEASLMFHRKYKKVPFLFIDGIDVLAKRDEELTTCLLTHAKYLANQGMLKIVLISNEGSVMPLVRKFSGANRAPGIFEIVDIDDRRAVDCLKENGLPHKLSNMLINYYGGRLIYMIGSISLYKPYVDLGMTDETALFKQIKWRLFSRKLADERIAISQKRPLSDEIIAAVSKGIVCPSELLDKYKSVAERDSMYGAIAHLVDRNVIRYTTNGFLTWHGRVEEHHFKVNHNQS